MGTFQIPLLDFARVATAVKSAMTAFGGGLVYSNEGGWYNSGFYNNGKNGTNGFTYRDVPALPDALDLFSFDGYTCQSCGSSLCCSGVSPTKCSTMHNEGMDHWNLSFRGYCAPDDPLHESIMMRQMYEKLLYPKMAPHQRLFVVPGTFADGNLSHGSLASQDEYIAAKLEGYAAWMREDKRLAGVFAWHWASEPSGSVNRADSPYQYGAIDLPKTIAVLEALANETQVPQVKRGLGG